MEEQVEKPYIYPLRKLLKYTKKKNEEADFENTGEIIFAPPSMDSFDESSDFKQIIMNAMVSAGRLSPEGKEKSEEEEETEKKVIKPSEIKAMLFASELEKVSVRKVSRIFKKLAVRTATLDESGTKLKDSHFTKISIPDFEDMLCGYAAFFSLPSLLSSEEGEPEKAGSD